MQPSQSAIFCRDHGDTKLPDSFLCEGHIDKAPTMVEHMIDALGGHLFRGEAEKAIALRRILVDEDHHAAGADLFKTFFDGGNGHRAFANFAGRQPSSLDDSSTQVKSQRPGERGGKPGGRRHQTFGISNGKSQIANLKSEICDLQFRASARTGPLPSPGRVYSLVSVHYEQCGLTASFHQVTDVFSD